MTGFFITFEGGEGAGKTTQAARLVEYLRGAGRAVTATREPGGTPLGERLRGLLLTHPMPAKAEALLYLAARVVHVTDVIRPALDRGDVVVCDRFADSTGAYQGFARGLGVDTVADMSTWATGGLHPDLVLLLDVDPTVGLARSGRGDLVEQEPDGFHETVRAGFAHLLADQFRTPRPRTFVIDAGRPVDVVSAEVAAAVACVLPPDRSTSQ